MTPEERSSISGKYAEILDELDRVFGGPGKMAFGWGATEEAGELCSRALGLANDLSDLVSELQANLAEASAADSDEGRERAAGFKVLRRVLEDRMIYCLDLIFRPPVPVAIGTTAPPEGGPLYEQYLAGLPPAPGEVARALDQVFGPEDPPTAPPEGPPTPA